MSLDAMKQALAALEEINQLSIGENAICLPAEIDTTMDALRAAIEQAQEPVAWRGHVEQRMLTWRQSFVNKSGDQLALDDFMDKRSLDDLIDFVCDEYTAPRQWQGLTNEERGQVINANFGTGLWQMAKDIEAKLKEKNT